MERVGILNYGIGNIGSISNMIYSISNKHPVLVSNKEELKSIDGLILPGVGKFDTGVQLLHETDLFESIKKFALEERKPLLGICLGMQLLGNKSEEGKLEGLGLLDFDVRRFTNLQLKIPHMGWNYTKIEKNDLIVSGLEETDNRYYFVHSFYAACENKDLILMTTEYGERFVSAISKDNIIGVQFHPEKSHKFGKKLLSNFIKEY